MKILLIYPRCLEPRSHELFSEDAGVTPIGLYYLGALLKSRGHQVEILNWYQVEQTDRDIRDMLLEKNPDLVGFSIVNANRFGATDTAALVKKILPGTVTVLGGIGATFLWEHLLKNFAQVDYILLGEGELSLLQLVSRLESRETLNLEDIKGLAFRRGAEAVCTGFPEPIQDLDQLPSPAEYFTFQHLVSSRGCPSNCSFCGSPEFWRRKVRFHSPAYFVDMLQKLYEKGVTFFLFSDDTFTLKPERVIEICRTIISRGLKISWFAISRVNCVDEDMLTWMRRAGCIQVSYGIESGSPKIRKALNKEINNQEIQAAFEQTVSCGILARAYFIYGSPGETRETIRESMDLMERIKPLSAVFYILEMFPGTALYRELKQKSTLTDDFWLEKVEHIKYFEIDQSMTPEMVLEFGRMLRTCYYQTLPRAAREIKLKDEPGLYPLHADFLSRLGMTFSHGDYSAIQEIPDKEKTAELLFEKSLAWYPNERAYLGLSIIRQKQGRYQQAYQDLSQGLKHFPGSENLAACQCISCMNLGLFQEALEHTDRFPDSHQMQQFRQACGQALAGRT